MFNININICVDININICADNGEALHQRKFLIFVNPVGGQGKAVAQFEKIVRPLFELAEIKYDVIFTGKYLEPLRLRYSVSTHASNAL